MQSFSIAGTGAASNLLMKAIRTIGNGEPVRAQAYVERALQLPYDRHEQSHPAAMEAHMALFCLVADALEVADEDDSQWLSAVLPVLAACVAYRNAIAAG